MYLEDEFVIQKIELAFIVIIPIYCIEGESAQFVGNDIEREVCTALKYLIRFKGYKAAPYSVEKATARARMACVRIPKNE
jgi:hypothetical protein